MSSKLRTCAHGAVLAALFTAAWPPIGGPGRGAALAAREFLEYQVKTEFLEKMAEFVDWPENAFSRPEEPFTLLRAGESPFDPYLEEMVRGGKIKGRRVLLRRIEKGEAPGHCHLLLVAKSRESDLQGLLTTLAGRPVLVVGDGKDFAEKGAHIGLYRAGNRVRFAINQDAARRSGLTISSKLLRLAAAVYGGNSQ